MVNTLLEKQALTLGFMPLTDSAPLVVAKEFGFFEKYGLDVTLEKQNSWATMRDKICTGLLDAAQMLAPMPIASSLGVDGQRIPMITPLVLSRNGNAITLGKKWYPLLGEHQLPEGQPVNAEAIKPLVALKQQQGEKLKLATVFPYSCHYYQLLDWLTNAGIDLEQIEILIIPPGNMTTALKLGHIDGFCVGGPWNAFAVRAHLGFTGVTSSDIWVDFPEKVLGMLASWQLQNPQTCKALVQALNEACHWLESIPNRFEAAQILSQSQYLNMDLNIIAPSLLGSCLTFKDLPPRQIDTYNQFADSESLQLNCPNIEDGRWLLEAMQKAGHLADPEQAAAQLPHIYRPDLFQQYFE
ncbi:CmpA/NrtA family ABC transporter substrate-binding protein [Thalassotalea sp. PS06]|uniref:CmpA/NrtA family ABC transporter substrate-binding protein n=1 Tax=Thalassotalea sp. PS06 TaxID=2594005 RepID=UPI00116210E6|nr:CmpA/NrtA family ABC transporter substrate-binding protein [Thalassotalea sp. PS06]QDP00137.1 ABC transporter substrate-binding protein [Thalassotalea sp. PS06]